MKIMLDDKKECSIIWKDGSESIYEDFETAVEEILRELR